MEQKLNLKDVLDEIKIDLVKEHYTHFDLEIIDEIKKRMFKADYNVSCFYNFIRDLSYKDFFDVKYLYTEKFVMSNLFILDRIYIRYESLIEKENSLPKISRFFPFSLNYPNYVNSLAKYVCNDIQDRVNRKRQEFYLKSMEELNEPNKI